MHVLDEDAFFWTPKRRLKLARSLAHRGYLMDEWVTGGGMRLIRLPHSLNGLVSRVARPLDKPNLQPFDAVTDPYCLPGFTRNYAVYFFLGLRGDFFVFFGDFFAFFFATLLALVSFPA